LGRHTVDSRVGMRGWRGRSDGDRVLSGALVLIARLGRDKERVLPLALHKLLAVLLLKRLLLKRLAVEEVGAAEETALEQGEIHGRSAVAGSASARSSTQASSAVLRTLVASAVTAVHLTGCASSCSAAASVTTTIKVECVVPGSLV
jgi:hypothetical protein